MKWTRSFKCDPLPALLRSKDEAVRFFARRDLLGERIDPSDELWHLRQAERIVARQLKDGGWKYPSPKPRLRSIDNYNLLETYRALGELVERYGFDKRHPAIQHAARFVLAHQSRDGDIRGVYGTQYSPNYTAGFLELLSKAGFGGNPQVRRAYAWLLSIRQDDGGWAVPLRTAGKRAFFPALLSGTTIQPIASKPSAHLVTGVVLRALAAHPRYRRSSAARASAALLASRLFKPDTYSDRCAADFWLHFSFPFWFTDLVSALDSLSIVGVPKTEPSIARALAWLAARQSRNGLWTLRMVRGGGDVDHHAWLTLAICRVFKRYR